MIKLFYIFLSLLLICSPVDARVWHKGGQVASLTQTITGVTPSSGNFSPGASSGTVISAVNVTMSSGSFTGTLSLTGTDASSFQLSSSSLPSNLETNGVLCGSPPCTYNFNIVATQGGAGASPFTQAVTVTSTAAGVVQTITLVSTSGSTVAANTPSPPMFGLQFPSCVVDSAHCIPTGEYPQLQATDGTAWPATYINRSSWSDGSIKHISVLPGPFPKSISTSGTTANILSGGSAPSASGLTEAAIYTEDIKLNVNGFTSSLGTGLGLSGNWAALLENDANKVETITYGDGGGGKVYRILTHVQQGGTAHGQLEVYWYVQQLLNSSGGLAGYRVLPRLTQPWYDVDSPVTKGWRGLQTFNIDCATCGSPITPPFQYTPADISWDNDIGNPWLFTTTTNNWFNGGSATYGGGNLVPGYLTTTGTLPAGLSLNTVYHMQTNGTSAISATLRTGFGDFPTITTAGTGTHTFHPIPLVKQFGTLWGAQANGRPTYIQGAGTEAADAPIRIKFDNTARHATRVFPPFDLSLTPDANPDTLAGYTYSWDIASLGPLYPFTGTTGERDDIGLFNKWQVKHFYNQTAADELYVRMIGLAGAYLTDNVRDSGTRQPPRMDDPANSYTGLPAAISNFSWDSKFNYAVGFTGPTNGGSQMFNGNEPDHMPFMAPYAYLVTGEPQYLDVMTEIAAAIPGAGWCDNCGIGIHPNRNPIFNAVQYYGIITYESDNGTRKSAWGLREIVYAAGLYPDTDPYGTQIKNYLTHMMHQNIAFMNTWVANAGSYFSSIGFWTPTTGQINAWQLGYMIYVNGVAAMMAEDSSAVTFLQTQSTFFNHILSTYSGWQLHDFYRFPFASGICNAPGTETGVPLTNSDLFASIMGVDATGVFTLTSTTGTPAFTWAINNPTAADTGFVPTNGDKIVWYPYGCYATNTEIPGGFTAGVPYYAINVSGNTFDLAASPGGARIPVTSGTVSFLPDEGIGLIAAAPSSTGIGAGYPYPDSYMAIFRGSMNYMIAAGITGLSPVATDTATRFNSMLSIRGLSENSFYQDNPKNAVGTSF